MTRRVRLRARRQRGFSRTAWGRYYFGRLLQVIGLVLALVAVTAFFGSPDTTAMLRTMLVGVLFFIPGWLLARRDPNEG